MRAASLRIPAGGYSWVTTISVSNCRRERFSLG